MIDDNKPATRRTILAGAALLAGLPLLAQPRQAQAGTMPQANAKYQTSPKGTFKCSGCNYFVPGATGACKIVAGVISPNGWCQLYAPKHA